MIPLKIFNVFHNILQEPPVIEYLYLFLGQFFKDLLIHYYVTQLNGQIFSVQALLCQMEVHIVQFVHVLVKDLVVISSYSLALNDPVVWVMLLLWSYSLITTIAYTYRLPSVMITTGGLFLGGAGGGHCGCC